MNTTFVKNGFKHYIIPFAVASALFLTNTMTAGAQTLVADSASDFSGVQGLNSWFYGYYDRTGDADGIYNYNTDFQLMTQLVTGNYTGYNFPVEGPIWFVKEGDGGFWSGIGKTFTQPNGLVTTPARVPREQWTVRRYISEVSGAVTISGNIAKDQSLVVGNGVLGRIYVDGSPVFTQFINTGDVVGTNFSITVNLNAGSVVDYVVDPFQSDDRYDGTRTTMQVVAQPGAVIVPEDTTSELFFAGALLGCISLAFVRKRKYSLASV